MKTLKDIPKNGASSEYSGDWSIDYDDLKDVAKEWKHAIQSGEFDRNIPEEYLTSLAKEYWNDKLFSLGMEYGALAFILKFFNLDVEDEEEKQEDSN